MLRVVNRRPVPPVRSLPGIAEGLLGSGKPCKAREGIT